MSSSSNIKRPKNVKKRRKGLAVARDFVLERERERLLSRFLSDPTVGTSWDKKESYSTHRGLSVGTGFGSFRQTP